MACASWITAVAVTTVGDMSEPTPGSSQHPEIPGAAAPQDSGSPPTGRWARLRHEWHQRLDPVEQSAVISWATFTVTFARRTRGQTSAPSSHRDHCRRYKRIDGPTFAAGCKARGHTGCTDQGASAAGARKARTALCIGTTRPGTDNAAPRANRGDGRRCRPCIGTDCLRRDDTTPGDRDCSVGIKPRRCVDQRCCQGVWHQLPDGAADRGGCR